MNQSKSYSTNSLLACALLLMGFGSVAHADDVVTPAAPEQFIRDKYCRAGRPRRVMKEVLTVQIPSPPDGIPLDLAQKYIAGDKEAARALARNFFVHPRVRTPQQNQIAGFKEGQLISDHVAVTRYGFRTNSYSVRDHRLTPDLSEVPSWEDLAVLKGAYSINLPFDEWNRRFMTDRELKLEGLYEMTDPFSGIHSDGTGHVILHGKHMFSPGALIQDRWNLWAMYARKFTTIKEASTGTGLRFEVALDMTVFCANSVAISDLITKQRQ